jgi:hypothetical protein
VAGRQDPVLHEAGVARNFLNTNENRPQAFARGRFSLVS